MTNIKPLKSIKIMITGHRPDKLNSEYNLKGPLSGWLAEEIKTILVKEQPTELITGMALGTDQLFALIGIELGIKVFAAIPFNGQQSIWPAESQDLYKTILENSLVEKFVVSPGTYDRWKMQKRNQFMADRCDKAIAVFDGSSGGTKNCVDYLTKIKKPTFVINPLNFKKDVL